MKVTEKEKQMNVYSQKLMDIVKNRNHHLVSIFNAYFFNSILQMQNAKKNKKKPTNKQKEIMTDKQRKKRVSEHLKRVNKNGRKKNEINKDCQYFDLVIKKLMRIRI